MDIATKYKIVEKIIHIEDEMLLQEVNALLNMAETDFWDRLPTSTKESIQRGLEDTKEGRTRPHQEVVRDIRARFTKQPRQ